MLVSKLKVFLRVLVFAVIVIFVWQPQQTMFFVFDVLTQTVPRIQLSAIPAPPKVTFTDSALGPLTGEVQYIRYYSSLTKEEVISFYEQVLPSQGWTMQVREERFMTCIDSEWLQQKRVIEIYESRRSGEALEVEVMVMFPGLVGMCNVTR